LYDAHKYLQLVRSDAGIRIKKKAGIRDIEISFLNGCDMRNLNILHQTGKYNIARVEI
jgi:hypothetical protein